MEWLERFNRAMDYIEEHLAGEIAYDQAAKLAGCSTFHFQRVFSYIADIPLSEYIRHRRMTLAAVDLQTTEEKIIDISLKNGYEYADGPDIEVYTEGDQSAPDYRCEIWMPVVKK